MKLEQANPEQFSEASKPLQTRGSGHCKKNGGKIAQGLAGARAGKSRHDFRILL